MNEVVNQSPWSTWQLIAGLLTRKRVSVHEFVPMSIRLSQLACSAESRAEFKLMLNCQTLPPSFLFNIAYRHLGQLLAQAKFPSKLLGLIHLSSEYHVHSVVDWCQTYDLQLTLSDCTRTDKGYVYQIDISLSQAGQLCLVCQNKVLDKDQNYRGGRSVSTSENSFVLVANNLLTAKLARNYAALSGDYNPIHLSNLLAKLFGMKKAVIHGMYNLHWCLTQVPASQHATTIIAQFNRPCYLPSHVALVEMNEHEYGLFSENRQNRHLQLQID
jgi:hypothetical protein